MILRNSNRILQRILQLLKQEVGLSGMNWEEETGVRKMAILGKLMVTRHVYRSNVGKRIIKKSHWYLIETKKQTLIPQTDEDIEKAVWMTMDRFFSKKREVYPNILEVLHTQDTTHLKNKLKAKVKN